MLSLTEKAEAKIERNKAGSAPLNIPFNVTLRKHSSPGAMLSPAQPSGHSRPAKASSFQPAVPYTFHSSPLRTLAALIVISAVNGKQASLHKRQTRGLSINLLLLATRGDWLQMRTAENSRKAIHSANSNLIEALNLPLTRQLMCKIDTAKRSHRTNWRAEDPR